MKPRAPSVLLIEDEERIQRLCRRILERAGLAIVGARSLSDGLRALRARRFKLLISDMILPDGSGLEALTEFRRLNPSAPMIVMTGAAGEDAESRARTLGLCRTLYKPFDIAEFEGAVEAAVGGER